MENPDFLRAFPIAPTGRLRRIHQGAFWAIKCRAWHSGIPTGPRHLARFSPCMPARRSSH